MGRGWGVNVAAVTRSGQVRFEQQEALLSAVSVFLDREIRNCCVHIQQYCKTLCVCVCVCVCKRPACGIKVAINSPSAHSET